jgi:hypothetical protein
MDTSIVVPIFAVGSATLGLWILARFPSFGPRSVVGALVLAAATVAAQTPLLRLVPVAAAAGGAPAALMLVILPALTLLFWSVGCVFRSLVLLLDPYRR